VTILPIVILVVLVIVGLGLVIFGGFVLLKFPNSPGGKVAVPIFGEVSSVGAGLPLIFLGLAAIVFATTRALDGSNGPDKMPTKQSGKLRFEGTPDPNVVLRQFYSAYVKAAPPTGLTRSDLERLGRVFHVNVRVTSFEGKAGHVVWSVWDANNRAQLAGDERADLPESGGSPYTCELWVPYPTVTERMFVRARLFVEAKSLDVQDSAVIRLGGIPANPAASEQESGEGFCA